MATLTTEGRNLACDAVVDVLDTGFVVFETSGSVEVATCTFGATAFGASAAGVATANAITADSSATGGTIDHAEVQKSDNSEIFDPLTCTVTGGGGDIQLSSLVIGAGDTVSITSMTVTMPAS